MKKNDAGAEQKHADALRSRKDCGSPAQREAAEHRAAVENDNPGNERGKDRKSGQKDQERQPDRVIIQDQEAGSFSFFCSAEQCECNADAIAATDKNAGAKAQKQQCCIKQSDFYADSHFITTRPHSMRERGGV